MPKAIRTLPSAEYLHQCFEYDAETGELRWKHRPREHFKSQQAFISSNARFAGKISGKPTPKGYLQTCINNRRFYVSRIIYKMCHGEDPLWIDHRDRNRSNNILSNLRSVTMQQNNQNMLKRAGMAGYTGVNQKTGPWRKKRFAARIGPHFLGLYHTAEEAHAAYREGVNKLFGEFSPFYDHESTLGPPTVHA